MIADSKMFSDWFLSCQLAGGGAIANVIPGRADTDVDMFIVTWKLCTMMLIGGTEKLIKGCDLAPRS